MVKHNHIVVRAEVNKAPKDIRFIRKWIPEKYLNKFDSILKRQGIIIIFIFYKPHSRRIKIQLTI